MAVLREDVIARMSEFNENCMGDSEAACVTTCPMNTDARGYVKLIGEGKGKEAIKLIRENLFLPGTLGRICAHPCEKNCRRGDEDLPIAIASLKRYAADNFDNPEEWDLSKENTTGKKVAVIGAGPAGAQGALELARNGHKITLFEKLPVLGGMMRVGIPEYRLPRDIIDKEYNILEKMGVEIKLETEIGKDIAFDDIKKSYDAILVAVGKHKGRIDTRLKNSGAVGVYNAADYLKEISLTGEFKNIGKKVAIIGGGDVAMDCARSSVRIGAVETVYSIPLEATFDEMSASNHEIEGAVEEEIKFKLGNGIDKILTDENNRVNGIVLKRCLSLFDDNCNFNPKFDENTKEILEVDAIVFAIGQGIDSSFDTTETLAKKNNGNFAADYLTMQSVSEPKVFIAGDCANSLIVVEALAEGRRAAKSIDRFLKNQDLKAGRDISKEGTYITKLYLPTEYLPEGWDTVEKRKRVVPQTIDNEARKKNFDEVEKVFTKEEAEIEANRCLQCQCRLCMKECIMLNEYTKCPKALFTEYLEKGIDEMEAKIAYSCNMCHQCTLKCPKDFDIKANFAAMRSEYVKDNAGKSPMPGHKAIEVHQYLGYSNLFNTTNAAPGSKTKYVFFPGCSLPSYNPEAIGNILDHLNSKLDNQVGSLLKCCGKPPKALGQDELFKKRFHSVQTEIDKLDAEVVIVACQSCYGIFENYGKQKVVSLWELLPEIGLPESALNVGKDSDVIFNIHDSCSIRNKDKIHEGIRWIVNEMGYDVEELLNSKDKTRCCGFGGMIVPAVPEIAQKVMKRRADESTTGHMITYCAACRESMEKGGQDAQHILDLVFGEGYKKVHARKRNMGPVKQWMNRFKTKMELKRRGK